MVIDRFRGKYPIRAMCKFLGISESGYYAFAKRAPRTSRDESLGQLIIQCQNISQHTYGYRRVCLWLRSKAGVIVNHKAVLRVMRKYGLLSEVRRKRRYHRYGEYLLEHPNLLNRNFYANTPNQKWVTDISYIKTGQGTLYLSVIKDLYDGCVIAFKTAKRNDNSLVLQTLKQAQKEVADGLILHSDQGFQYAATAYLNLTREYGIVPSMSRKGTPIDNAPAESFFSTLKAECLYRQKINTFEHADRLIAEYIHFYNYQRIQLKSRLTPFEKRCQSA